MTPSEKSYPKFYVEIPLTRNQFAKIDLEDLPKVMKYRWHAMWSPFSQTFYVASNRRIENGKYKRVHLHRLVLDVPDEHVGVVDHANHNGLDCRKGNLRLCNKSQNGANQKRRSTNSSGFKGVSFYPQNGKWRAIICCQYKDISLGLHFTKEDAARAYDRKAIELFGEFAHTNFPISDYEVELTTRT